jgi:5-methylcytosine-specific restriction endonuclease McrBC regulatory subunit McrC
MIRQIQEGEISWLIGLSLVDIPKSLPKGISLHIKDGVLGIESQNVIGTIPLGNGDTLQIIPKIGRVNFLHLLFKAEGNQKFLESEFDNFVEYSLEDDRNIDSIVARQLVLHLEVILRRSPLIDRVKITKSGQFACGQIDVVKTAINIACRNSDPVVSSVKEKTINTAENRILTEALLSSWSVLAGSSKIPLKGTYDRWMRRFPRSTRAANDLLEIERKFASGGYGGSRDYYRRALMLAKIILGGSGVGFDNDNTLVGDAVLINAADVFEKYVRSVISSAYQENGFIVSKGGAGIQSLYSDGSFELIPDVVIRRDNKILLIADAKYKKPTAADHYQMAAYLAAHGVSRGLLLAPLFSGDDLVIKEYATDGKIIVREVYLPMHNLPAVEETLSSILEVFSH